MGVRCVLGGGVGMQTRDVNQLLYLVVRWADLVGRHK
jgi:hypothetical protein